MRNLLVSLMLCLVSCSSCTKSEDTTNVKTEPVSVGSAEFTMPDAGPPVSTDQLVISDNVSILIPKDWVRTDSVTAVPELQWMYLNKGKKNVIMLIKEQSKNTLDVYTLESLRQVSEANAVLDSHTTVAVNGKAYSLLVSHTSADTIWLWLSVDGDYSYALSCGGKTDFNNDGPDSQEAMCNKMVQTLKFN